MTSRYHRQFDVDYLEEDAGTWSAAAYLIDEMHGITIEADVAAPDCVVRDVSVSARSSRGPAFARTFEVQCPRCSWAARGARMSSACYPFRHRLWRPSTIHTSRRYGEHPSRVSTIAWLTPHGTTTKTRTRAPKRSGLF